MKVERGLFDGRGDLLEDGEGRDSKMVARGRKQKASLL
jgi:hypothetical protein